MPGTASRANRITDKQGLRNGRLWQSPIFSHLLAPYFARLSVTRCDGFGSAKTTGFGSLEPHGEPTRWRRGPLAREEVALEFSRPPLDDAAPIHTATETAS